MTEQHARRIVVAGDIVIDYHIYEGERLKPAMVDRRGLSVVQKPGGAAGLCDLLTQLMRLAAKAERPGGAPAPPTWDVRLGTVPPAPDQASSGHHAFALWKPFARTSADPAEGDVWRAVKLMGYGGIADPGAPEPHYAPGPAAALPRADILVLDDAGYAFRLGTYRDTWLLPRGGEPTPGWILLKLSGPIGQGDLWHEVSHHFADRLVCLVSANDLRREYVGISAGLSWERTVEDLHQALRNSPALNGLQACKQGVR